GRRRAQPDAAPMQARSSVCLARLRLMVRHTSLPYRPIPLAVIVVVLLAPAARAQDYSVQDRLDRIERDVNMLQRQVYRGAPPSAAAGGPPPAAPTPKHPYSAPDEKLPPAARGQERAARAA